MPFNYAHALLALRAHEALGAPAAGLIAACPSAFRAGALGPDPYFADAMPAPLLRPCRAALAGRMHGTDAAKLLRALLPAAESPAQRAYVLGMLCHFLLDAHAHAYICARFPDGAHTPAEMRMDLPFLDHMGAPAPAGPPWRFFRLGRRALDEIDALHAAAVHTLFAEESRGAFRRSYRKWIGLISRLSYDPRARKRGVLVRLERLLGRPGALSGRLVTRDPADARADHMNLRHAVWAAPWAPECPRRESFPELFLSALKEAPALLDAAAEGFRDGDFARLYALIEGRCMDGSPLL
ncbi:MAG: zinc dependent phospholipase C family protein [Clostridia bacterium]|nr:zinc dependent phospholipase C family protein [Clostridia bacterium]